jgi:hypothetical protein
MPLPFEIPGKKRRCGARTHTTGERCRQWPVPGKHRCKWHGGLSPGPRTPEGKAVARAMLAANLARYLATLRATGQKRTSGRRKGGRWKTKSMWQRECQELLRLPDDPAAALAKIQSWVDEYKKAHDKK